MPLWELPVEPVLVRPIVLYAKKVSQTSSTYPGQNMSRKVDL